MGRTASSSASEPSDDRRASPDSRRHGARRRSGGHGRGNQSGIRRPASAGRRGAATAAPRIGEILPASSSYWLRRLGVWEAFQSEDHPACPGIVSAWESKEPYEHDFIFDPLGGGWQVDRRRFDRMLAHAAGEAGAMVLRRARVLECSPHGSTWIAQYDHGGRRSTVQAKFVVDATGRRAWFARRQNVARRSCDLLVGIAGLGDRARLNDSRTYLEATANGWWYVARSRRRQAVAVYLTDADLLPHGRQELQQFWQEQLTQTSLVGRLFGNRPSHISLRRVSANTSRLNSVSGLGWLAVGDAAFARDPLSGQGIVSALESGIRAADDVRRSIVDRGAAAFDYVNWINNEFDAYLIKRASHYASVTRWPTSQFWSRRQTSRADVGSQLRWTPTVGQFWGLDKV